MRRWRDGPLCSTARHSGTLRAPARTSGRWPDRRVGADVARQGQRKAAGARRTAEADCGQPAAGRACADLRPRMLRAALLHVRTASPARRAPRALEVVEKVVTGVL
jgi:hypothetical protein